MNVRIPALAALLVCRTSAAQEAPPVHAEARVTVTAPADPVQPFRASALSGRSLSAAGVAFDAGAGRYALSAGTLWEMRSPDGRVTGFWFSGEGTLTWKAGDEAASRVYADNASRLGGLKGTKEGLVAPFAAAVFFLSEAGRPDLPEPQASGAPAPEAALREHLERFAEDRLPSPWVGLAAAALDRRVYFAALLRGGEDLRHEVDDVLSDEEAVAVLRKPAGAPVGFPPWRFASVVARRPVGRTRRAAPRVDWKLVAVDADVRETEKDHGLLRVEETIVPQRPLRSALFELRSEDVASRTYAVRATKLTAVTDGEGRPLAHAFEKDALAVFFPAPLAPGAPVKLVFSYDAPFFERVGGDNYWELPIAGAWYPQPVSLGSASAHTWHANVRAKKPFLPLAAGETVRRAEDGEWNLLEARLDRPVPFANVLAGNYTFQEETKDGVTCRVASYGVSKEKSGAKLANLFHRIREFYEPYLGPFPWKEYTIVEINSYGFGQAPPGMMRLTREGFQGNILGDPVAELFSAGINERIAHEMAHSYFGYVVWDADRDDQWISEAFSEVAAGRVIEMLKDKGEYRKLANVWRERGKDASGRAPIAFANELAVPPGNSGAAGELFRDRTYLVYFKGAALLTKIREEVGDDAFFTVLKSFLRSFEKRPAVTTEQFVGLLGYVTKKDWAPWFERHYWGSEMP